MNEEIKLKKETKTEIIDGVNTYDKFLFRLEEENNELVLYVNELFYSSNLEIQKQIIQTILATTYVHSTKNMLDSNFNLISEERIENYLFTYILTSNIDRIKKFKEKISKLKLKSKLLKLLIEEDISLGKFNMILKTHHIKINDSQQEKLKGEYIFVKNQKIVKENTGNNILKGISLADKSKGDIFQLLCARLIFNNQDNYYYNLSSGASGNLYPDLIFKIQGLDKVVFIGDAKCYTNDEDIKPHKEFLYNILTTHVNNKNTVIGILFTYEKDISNKPYRLKKIHKFADHYFYLVSLNINILLENLVKENKVSYATEIGNFIMKNHSQIKKIFKTDLNNDINTTKIDSEKVELVHYRYNMEIKDFINNQ